MIRVMGMYNSILLVLMITIFLIVLTLFVNKSSLHKYFLKTSAYKIYNLWSMRMIGMIGMYELFLVFLIIIVALLIPIRLIIKSQLRKYFMSIFVRKIHVNKFLLEKYIINHGKRLPFLAFSMIFFFFFFVYIILLVGGFQCYSNECMLLKSILSVISIILFITAFAMHSRPNTNRKWKYRLLLIGTLMLPILLFMKDCDLYKILSMISILPVCVIIMFLLSAYLNLLIKKNKPTNGIISAIYKFIRIFSFPFVVVSAIIQIPEVIIPFLVVRFILIEYYSKNPVLFLRSFYYDEAKTVYGSIIAPVVNKYGVVFCIVSENQPTNELMSSASLTDFAYTSIVPDELWKKWILFHLEHCKFIVIDNTINTESIEWEIQTSIEKISSNKIIVIQREDVQEELTRGITTIKYSLDKNGMGRAKSLLMMVISKII